MTKIWTERAPAKINLALHVLGRRDDGYHRLDSAVAFADVGDVLELQEAATCSLTVDGPFAAGVPTTDDNLILQAHKALAGVADVPPVAFHLTKNLPVASGIGGGSADAAAALRGLIGLFGLTLPSAALARLALTLGADVPVCLHGKACRMGGIGENITVLEKLPAPALVLANPGVACGTADVFKALGLARGSTFGTPLDVESPQNWRNDLTTPASQVLPTIHTVLQRLAGLDGVLQARMSGSGATCFGLFSNLAEAGRAAAELQQLEPRWWVAASALY